jgi:hypothetical protein
MVSFPYPKALTANPFVNQGAALLVTDTDTARARAYPRNAGCTRSAARAPTSPDPHPRAYHRVRAGGHRPRREVTARRG